MKSDQQIVERKNLFGFENELSFAVILSEQKYVYIYCKATKMPSDVIGGGKWALFPWALIS